MVGRIVILGEGFAALVAAGVLTKRGFEVDVFDPRPPTSRVAPSSRSPESALEACHHERIGSVPLCAWPELTGTLEDLGVDALGHEPASPASAELETIALGDRRIAHEPSALGLVDALRTHFPHMDSAAAQLARASSGLRAFDVLVATMRDRGVELGDAEGWRALPAIWMRRSESLSSFLRQQLSCPVARAFVGAALCGRSFVPPSAARWLTALTPLSRRDTGSAWIDTTRSEVANQLRASAHQRGARFHRGVRPERITLDAPRSVGVSFATGELFRSDLVLSTLGAHATDRLLDSRSRRLGPTSGLLATVHARLDCVPRDLGFETNRWMQFPSAEIESTLALGWMGAMPERCALDLRFEATRDARLQDHSTLHASALFVADTKSPTGSTRIDRDRLDPSRAAVARRLLGDLLAQRPELAGHVRPVGLSLRTVELEPRVNGGTGPALSQPLVDGERRLRDAIVIGDDDVVADGFERSVERGIRLAERAEELLATRRLVLGREPARVTSG